jgi:transcriptional regulator with XRE-family HTH domain
MDKKIGQRIKTLRNTRNLTQEELADELGMSFGNLGKIERGEIDPNTETLQKVARVLKIHVAELFGESPGVAEPIEKLGFVTKDELRESIRHLENLIKAEMVKIREDLSIKSGYELSKKKTRRRKED